MSIVHGLTIRSTLADPEDSVPDVPWERIEASGAGKGTVFSAALPKSSRSDRDRNPASSSLVIKLRSPCVVSPYFFIKAGSFIPLRMSLTAAVALILGLGMGITLAEN